jgi:hypothetical protein
MYQSTYPPYPQQQRQQQQQQQQQYQAVDNAVKQEETRRRRNRCKIITIVVIGFILLSMLLSAAGSNNAQPPVAQHAVVSVADNSTRVAELRTALHARGGWGEGLATRTTKYEPSSPPIKASEEDHRHHLSVQRQHNKEENEQQGINLVRDIDNLSQRQWLVVEDYDKHGSTSKHAQKNSEFVSHDLSDVRQTKQEEAKLFVAKKGNAKGLVVDDSVANTEKNLLHDAITNLFVEYMECNEFIAQTLAVDYINIFDEQYGQPKSTTASGCAYLSMYETYALLESHIFSATKSNNNSTPTLRTYLVDENGKSNRKAEVNFINFIQSTTLIDFALLSASFNKEFPAVGSKYLVHTAALISATANCLSILFEQQRFSIDKWETTQIQLLLKNATSHFSIPKHDASKIMSLGRIVGAAVARYITTMTYHNSDVTADSSTSPYKEYLVRVDDAYLDAFQPKFTETETEWLLKTLTMDSTNKLVFALAPLWGSGKTFVDLGEEITDYTATIISKENRPPSSVDSDAFTKALIVYMERVRNDPQAESIRNANVDTAESVLRWNHELALPSVFYGAMLNEVIHAQFTTQFVSKTPKPSDIMLFIEVTMNHLTQLHIGFADLTVLLWKEKYCFNYWNPNDAAATLSETAATDTNGNILLSNGLREYFRETAAVNLNKAYTPLNNPIIATRSEHNRKTTGSQESPSFPSFPSEESGYGTFALGVLKDFIDTVGDNQISYLLHMPGCNDAANTLLNNQRPGMVYGTSDYNGLLNNNANSASTIPATKSTLTVDLHTALENTGVNWNFGIDAGAELGKYVLNIYRNK